VEIKEIFT